MSAPLVLFDGECGFCDVSVQWLLARSKDFRFAPLQGDTAREILARHPELPKGLDSVVFVETDEGGERVSYHSGAVFRICERLGPPWRVLSVFRFLPSFLTDLAYRLFARIRYSVWGRRDSCRIPRPEERARFLP